MPRTQVNAHRELISFEFHDKVTFTVKLSEEYPAVAPKVWYKSPSRPSDTNRSVSS